jgi:tetratricopeptide (TPR) repeat protein
VIDIDDAIRLETLEGLSDLEALDAIGTVADYALDHNDLELATSVLGWCDELECRQLSGKVLCLLDYFRANLWGHRQSAKLADEAAAWAWESEEARAQIYYLRRAMTNKAFAALNVLHRVQVMTNLANQLDTVGRFAEARETWTRALTLCPEFWMASGNRASGLIHYARALYDPGHHDVFVLTARRELAAAIEDLDAHPDYGDPRLRDHFEQKAQQAETLADLQDVETWFKPNDHSLGETPQERDYRRWTLSQTLFLNPLNDLGALPIAANDVLMLPQFTTDLDEPPNIIGFFNQLKQEFVSARWFYFEGINAEGPHFSDHEVKLYNTLDYPALGLGVEKTKMAFRMAYSLLDKIAYFLNHYMKIGIPESKVNFRTIWKPDPQSQVRETWEGSKNWPFRGLYWLSKDLFDKDFKELTDPDARALASLRNHLEHKYVKTVTMGLPVEPAANGGPFFDDLAHTVTRSDLNARTLRLLKQVRCALLYLVLGINRHERQKSASTPDRLRMGMHLDVWEDDWKDRF